MCPKLSDLCSGASKPMLLVGSLLTLLSGLLLGYATCGSHALYVDLDAQVAQERAAAHYAQLAGALYLVLVSLFACSAAYYDEKHSIRGLAIVSSANFVLAAAAIVLAPARQEVAAPFANRLTEAQKLYNFTDTASLPPAALQLPDLIEAPKAPNSTEPPARTRRWLAANETAGAPRPLDSAGATRLWDRLQAGEGCCGFRNYTSEWRVALPKSCCSQPVDLDGRRVCKEVDGAHSRACADAIGATSTQLSLVLALVALVNLFVATVSALSTYRTFHYREAPQSAYS